MSSNNPGTNPGSFMSPSTGQPSGTGSALQRLMALRQQNGGGQLANPQSPGYVAPPSNPTTNAINPSQISAAGAQQQPPAPAPQGPPGMGAQAPVPPNANGVNMAYDPHDQALQVAMEALGNYVGSHAKAVEAKHDVPRKQAEAKLIAAQTPQAAPVGA